MAQVVGDGLAAAPLRGRVAGRRRRAAHRAHSRPAARCCASGRSPLRPRARSSPGSGRRSPSRRARQGPRPPRRGAGCRRRGRSAHRPPRRSRPRGARSKASSLASPATSSRSSVASDQSDQAVVEDLRASTAPGSPGSSATRSRARWCSRAGARSPAEPCPRASSSRAAHPCAVAGAARRIPSSTRARKSLSCSAEYGGDAHGMPRGREPSNRVKERALRLLRAEQRAGEVCDQLRPHPRPQPAQHVREASTDEWRSASASSTRSRWTSSSSIRSSSAPFLRHQNLRREGLQPSHPLPSPTRLAAPLTQRISRELLHLHNLLDSRVPDGAPPRTTSQPASGHFFGPPTSVRDVNGRSAGPGDRRGAASPPRCAVALVDTRAVASSRSGPGALRELAEATENRIAKRVLSDRLKALVGDRADRTTRGDGSPTPHPLRRQRPAERRACVRRADRGNRYPSARSLGR